MKNFGSTYSHSQRILNVIQALESVGEKGVCTVHGPNSKTYIDRAICRAYVGGRALAYEQKEIRNTETCLPYPTWRKMVRNIVELEGAK